MAPERERLLTAEDLRHRFEYHPPRSEQRRRAHESVRTVLFDAAVWFNGELPDGREKAVAMTKLEEAMFWANAALARSVDDNADA